MRRHWQHWLILAVLLGVATTRAAEYYEVLVEREVAVKMPDGITLRADIYRPKAEGKFPVLVQRTLVSIPIV